MPGRRHSKKREAILELIRSTRTHPKAQWVHEQLKSLFPVLSLGTVYRNIKILLEEGELASAGVINGEERFDGELQPHSHAICTGCGHITDLDEALFRNLSGSFPVKIPGFSIDIKKTVFYGLCSACKPDSLESAALGR